jgi:hypothetical protein
MTALVIAILAVLVIMPHIAHPQTIYHIFLHIISLIIAIFLSVISIIAYNRNNSTRTLFMALGFILLAVIEFLYLFHATQNIGDVIIPVVDIELSHVILLVMLILFGIGVLKVNK